MSLYVDDPMNFISGRLPQELSKYISLEEWREIVERLMRCEQNGTDCACYTSACMIITIPLLCPLLCCFQNSVNYLCIKQNSRTACHVVNVLYFDRKKVFEVGPENSVYIHYCRMEGEEPTIDTQPNAASPPQAHAEIVTGGREGERGKGKERGGRKSKDSSIVEATAVQIDTTTIPGYKVKGGGDGNDIDYRVSSAQLQANTEANASSARRPDGRKSRVPPAPKTATATGGGNFSREITSTVGKGVKFSAVDEISTPI